MLAPLALVALLFGGTQAVMVVTDEDTAKQDTQQTELAQVERVNVLERNEH